MRKKQVLELLKVKPMTLADLADELGLRTSQVYSVYRTLKKNREATVVGKVRDRQGKNVRLYGIPGSKVEEEPLTTKELIYQTLSDDPMSVYEVAEMIGVFSGTVQSLINQLVLEKRVLMLQKRRNERNRLVHYYVVAPEDKFKRIKSSKYRLFQPRVGVESWLGVKF